MVLYPNPNERAKVVITSLAHKSTVEFFPYDFEFDDNYKPEWSSYEALGRMDPIMIYKRTSRDVNLSFNVVAESAGKDSVGQSEFNFIQLQKLIQFLYPIYEPNLTSLRSLEEKYQGIKKQYDNISSGVSPSLAEERIRLSAELQKAQNDLTTQQDMSQYGAQTIKKSPLITISFMNLLNNQQYVAAITSFKHKMKFDTGNTSIDSAGKAIPGEFNINIGFKIIHTSIPGTSINYNL